ncbi:hypothetical protein PAPYR_7011 [Paratrimastix pyriformis]|uniref:Uncharacterized protein n=1 Tax=Paratrimastix pyriformis TaxID=342808 RepID=A0ABQ8UH78_9EUKA|nr:hypothetical protein PAPYR_7011 [Paratrimastix pyriformis]
MYTVPTGDGIGFRGARGVHSRYSGKTFSVVQYVVSLGTQLIVLNNVRMVGGEIYPEFRLEFTIEAL